MTSVVSDATLKIDISLKWPGMYLLKERDKETPKQNPAIDSFIYMSF